LTSLVSNDILLVDLNYIFSSSLRLVEECKFKKGLYVSELPDKKNSVSRNITAVRLIDCSLTSSE